MKRKTNRNYRDGVFRSLFNEKEKMLELYNAVADTDYGEEMLDKIKVLTIENPLYLGLRNDVAFSLPEKVLFFTEHQSTLCGNIPIRTAGYFGEVLQDMFGDEIYRERKLFLAPPEFYILYNGGLKTPQEQIFKLSDHYIKTPPVNSAEIIVKFINICYNKDNKILQKSKTLREYSQLMHYIDANIKAGIEKDEAIDMAVKRAAEEKVLTEFLRKNGSEVVGMLHGEVTMERYGEIRREEGYEDGYEAGIATKRLDIAKNLKKLSIPIKDIAEATGLTIEEVEAL